MNKQAQVTCNTLSKYNTSPHDETDVGPLTPITRRHHQDTQNNEREHDEHSPPHDPGVLAIGMRRGRGRSRYREIGGVEECAGVVGEFAWSC